MRTVLILSLLIPLLAGTGTALADTITLTTSSPSVYYAVNDNGYYVESNPIHGTYASAYISGSNFVLSASGSGYSDAGIVLYFTGGLDLDDLQSITVATDNPSAVNINVWLDTGGDGQFFQFDSQDLLTSLNGDSYGSCGNGGVLTQSTTCYMEGTLTGSYDYTLTQLQNGELVGINGETTTALWIGVTNSNGNTDLSRITLTGAFDLSSTPEPGSLTLFGIGFLLIGVYLKRKQRNQVSKSRFPRTRKWAA